MEIWVGVVCLLEEIVKGVDSFHVDTTTIMEGDEGSSGPPPRGNCGERRLLPRGPNHHHGKEPWGGVGRFLEEIVEGGDSSHVDPTTTMVRSCGEEWAASSRKLWLRLLPSRPNHYHCKELWGGMGRLLEEIVEGGDSSYVDPTTIMVRRCGEGRAASWRRSWRVDTPPTWTPPPSW